MTHNLALVPAIADRVAVMQHGHIIEELPSAALRDATHTYTQTLIAAIPTLPR